MIREGSVYSLHPSFSMERTSIENLPKRTGKTLEEWIALLKAERIADAGAARAWLKAQHSGIGTNYAVWIVERSEGRGGADDYDPDADVEAMFAKKPALVPVYEAALKVGLALGDDVKVCPCQTMVPFYRKNVFAQLKPSTKSRLDVGFCLRGVADLPARLIDTGGAGKGDRITHRIPVERESDIDDDLKFWFRRAYELDA